MGTCFGHCFRPNSRRRDKCYSLYRCKTEYVQFGGCKETRGDSRRHPYLFSRLTSLLTLNGKKALREEVSLELSENSESFQFCNGYIAQSCVPCNTLVNPLRHINPLRRQSDVEFQALDAKALLGPPSYAGLSFTQEKISLNSTPPSSIDLEWEHEAYFNTRSLKDEEEDSDSAGLSLHTNFRSRRYFKSNHRSRLGSRQGSISFDSSTASKDGSRMTTPDSLEWDFVDSSIPTIDQETEQLIAEIEQLAANALQDTGHYCLDENEDT